jgi:ribosomal protein S18 acetylase RimI-like enzyme
MDPPPDGLRIRRTSAEDIPRLVEIHRAALGGALTVLGPRVIDRYYRRGLEDSGTLLLTAELPTIGVAGFLELVLHESGVARRFEPSDRVVVLGAALRHPLTAGLLLVRRRDGFAIASDDAAFLRFFAVDSRTRGRSIGAMLLGSAAQVATAAGKGAIETATTDRRLLRHYERRHGGTALRSWGVGPSSSTLVRMPLPLPSGPQARPGQ